MAKTSRRTAPQKSPKLQGQSVSAPLLPGPWLMHALAFLWLVIATCLLYHGDLTLGFFGVDDPDYVINNPLIRQANVTNLIQILTQPYFANYSPVHLLSYMLDAAIAGVQPQAFHWSSNVWAGIAAGMVYVAGTALTQSRIIGLLAGVLFVVHPSHVEAVAWVSNRKDPLAAAFALASFVCFVGFRRRNRRRMVWYSISIVMFVLAAASKQSVVVLPLLLWLYDVFIERRRGMDIYLDKLPFLAVCAYFAIRTIDAQPSTGHTPNLFVIGDSITQSLWLLSGFGRYFPYRPGPVASSNVFVVCMIAVPFVAIAAPLTLLRWIHPLVVFLWYWVVLSLLPAQALTFIHPVSDRYLFFPSVGFVMLLSWSVITAAQRWQARGTHSSTPIKGFAASLGAGAIVLALAAIWLGSTIHTLHHWQDPRSIWLYASQQGGDTEAHHFLGDHYHDASMAIDAARSSPAPTLLSNTVTRLALALWAGDPRLPSLLDDWKRNDFNSIANRDFQTRLRDEAWMEYEQALRTKGTLAAPNLYFRRAKLSLERGQVDQARIEFLAAYNESQRSTYDRVRQELAVRSHYALGVVEWTAGNYVEALRWMRMAEDEQTRYRANWEPELTVQRQRLEAMIDSKKK